MDCIDKFDFGDSRVWSLFGSNDNESWDCLQVAQSKSVSKEIKSDIEFMLDNKYADLLSEAGQNDRITKNTTFYIGAYEMKKGDDRRKYTYSKMCSEYKYFRVCILKIDEYLSFSGYDSDDEDIANILKIAKPLYAEAKLAYETLAKYWVMYSSGVDGQAILVFLERDR